jgi:hypothetical protein
MIFFVFSRIFNVSITLSAISLCGRDQLFILIFPGHFANPVNTLIFADDRLDANERLDFKLESAFGKGSAIAHKYFLLAVIEDVLKDDGVEPSREDILDRS